MDLMRNGMMTMCELVRTKKEVEAYLLYSLNPGLERLKESIKNTTEIADWQPPDF
jgi:hypothetical protein